MEDRDNKDQKNKNRMRKADEPAEKKQDVSLSDKPGAFQESIIKEQIKRRPINKYRLLRRTAVTALLAIFSA